MIVKKLSDVDYADMTGYAGVTKQIVIGPADGSQEIVLRYFSLEPGGTTPHHAHGFPHVVKVERGSGTVTDANGGEQPLSTGDFVYVDDDEIHHFTNTGSEPFDFICIVPPRGEQ